MRMYVSISLSVSAVVVRYKMETEDTCRVKSGIFGQIAKFGQPHCLFHSSVIGITNKLT